MRKVLAVIPVHERPEEIRKLLDSMQGLRRDSCALVVAVIDDGSSESLEGCVRKAAGNLTVEFFRNETPCGPAFCRNHVAGLLESDFLWFLDSDTEVLYPETLETILSALDEFPGVSAVGGAIEELSGQLYVQQLEFLRNGFYLYRVFRTDEFSGRSVSGFGTCNLLVTREAFTKVRGFAEDLLRDEDMDFCHALWRQGYRFYMETKTCVLHKCSSSGRDTGRFAFHRDTYLYLKAILETRTAILARHWPLRTALLPLLDLVFIPLIGFRVITKFYASKRIRYDVLGLSFHSLTVGGVVAYYLLKGYAVGLRSVIFGSRARRKVST